MFHIRWKEGTLPQPFTTTASWVHDGDTISVYRHGQRAIIRIWGIDAPEFGQAYYLTARHFLMNLLLDKPIHVIPRSLDRYGRIVASLRVPRTGDVARALLQAGLAWYDPLFGHHHVPYIKDQAHARQLKLAIWSPGSHKFPPWIWRRQHFTR
jgi:endonuclease YncB( thermonuclease family)